MGKINFFLIFLFWGVLWKIPFLFLEFSYYLLLIFQFKSLLQVIKERLIWFYQVDKKPLYL